MAWTAAEITALEDALKMGVKKVKYQDREVEYPSLREMSRLLQEARRSDGSGPSGRRFTLSSPSKGL